MSCLRIAAGAAIRPYWPASYFDEVLDQFDDVGLRGLLQAHPDDVHELEIDDPAALDDMDHPGDYQRELNR